MQFVRVIVLCVLAGTLVIACGSPEERAASYLEQAQEHFDSEDYVKAKLEARNAAQIEPKNAQARYLLALIAEQDGDFRKMIGHLQVAVDADPGHVGARVKLGTFYYFAQAYEEAATEAAAVLELAPDNPDVRLLNARILIQKEEKAQALEEIQAALAIDADHVEAILLHAAYYAEDDPSQALGIVDTAINRFSVETAEPLRQLRLILLGRAQRLDEVEAEYQALIEDFPDNENYRNQLARLYTSQGRTDEAVGMLRSIIEQDNSDVGAKLGLTQFLASVDGPEAAEEALKAFIAESPDQLELQLVLARFYESADRRADAQAVYAAVAEQSPASEDGLAARNRMAALKIQAGEIDDGRKLIEEILTEVPDNADALLIRAGLYLVDDNMDDAISDLRVVLRKEPESEPAMYGLARAYLRSDQRVLAVDAYRRLLEANPAHGNGARELAAVYVDQGEPDQAEAVLRNQVAADALNVGASAGLVELLLSEGKLAEAEQEARRMSEGPNTSGAGDFALARTLHAQKEYGDAINAYRQALEKTPTANLPLEGLVRAYSEDGRPEEAVRYLRDHAAQYPDQPHARFLLGGMLSRVGDTDGARKQLESVIADQPEATAAYAALSGTYPDSSDRIAIFKRGLAAVPASADLVLYLGSEYEREGRTDDAIAHYEEALAINPDLVIAVNNLAALLLDFRRDDASLAKALKLAQRFEGSKNPAFADTLGWAYYRSGDYAQAVKNLQVSVNAMGQAPMLRYHLGMALAAAKETDRAREELTKALDALPEGAKSIAWAQEAQETLANLDK